MNDNDVREFETSSHELVHIILKKIRECEIENIDVDEYIPKNDLRIVIDVLDCCLRNKNSRYIARRS